MAKKILAVDDDPEILRLLKIRLEQGGYQVVTASGGSEAIELAKREKPNLVILDILMPEMDGTETAARLHEDPKTRDIPILFLTCLFTKNEERKEGHEVGRQSFIAKPFDPQDLLEEIARLL